MSDPKPTTDTGIKTLREMVEAAHFLSIEQASELMADRDRLEQSLNECHRQHESVIERLDDAKAQVEVWRVRLESERSAREAAERDLATLVEAGSKAADDLARVGEFHTAGAWLWSSLDRTRPEFEEAERRRKRAAEIKDDLWKVLDKHIPDDGAST